MKLKERFYHQTTPFWFFTLAFMLGLIVPVLVMDGMFMDGVLYASVSNNLAQGYGSMWFLKFSDLGFAGNPTFHEHPPLVFWLQALFFKVFGNGMYVERAYSLLTALITACLMYKSWKLIHKGEPKIAQLSWISIFMWMLIPVSFWSYQNNVMENTMGIFIMLSFYFTLKALHFEHKVYLNLIFAGIFIFLASFSKGVPGLFTLGLAFFYWFVFRKFSFGKMVLYSLILLSVPIALYALIILFPEANQSLSVYFFERLLGRTTAQPTVDHRSWILIRLFMEILPLIIVVAIALPIMKWRKVKLNLNRSRYQMVAFLMLIGLSGSIPIMLTMVQKPFYFSSSLPFFGLAFAMFIAPGLSEGISKIKTTTRSYKVFYGITLVCLLGVFVVAAFQKGKASRNPDVIHDMYLVAAEVPNHSTIDVSVDMWNEWDMQCYMVRYWNISWDHNEEGKNDFFLLNRSLDYQLDSTYQKLDLPTLKYDLYKRKSDK
jgi:4-amino-4-deoxy-L-arabinose transferase-like glycosyltransferase